jgi:hypothetical protein
MKNRLPFGINYRGFAMPMKIKEIKATNENERRYIVTTRAGPQEVIAKLMESIATTQGEMILACINWKRIKKSFRDTMYGVRRFQAVAVYCKPWEGIIIQVEEPAGRSTGYENN